MLPSDEPTGSFVQFRNDDSFEEIVIDGEEEEISIVDVEDEALEKTTHEVSVLLVEPGSPQQPVMHDVPDEDENPKFSDNEEIEVDVCDDNQNEVQYDIDIEDFESLPELLPEPINNIEDFEPLPELLPEPINNIEENIEENVNVENVDIENVDVENVDVENDELRCDSDIETEKIQIPTFRAGLTTPDKCNGIRESVDLISPVLGGKRRTSKRRSGGKKSSSNEVEILTIYPPPPAKGGISINSEDYKCLAVNEYLNDVIIDFYLKYLLNEILSPDDRRRTHVFSSHFFTRLANPYATNPAPGDESNGCFRYDNLDDDEDTAENKAAARLRHAGVQRWTKNVNIFEKDFIIVPINEASHWFLAIICFPYLVGQVGRRFTDCVSRGNELQKPCILILDSLSTSSKAKVAGILREYLYCEYMAKMQDHMEFTYEAMKTGYLKVPKQMNATDCGLYLLHYVESFFQNPIQDFTLPFKDMRDWFRSSDIRTKRAHIARIIANLSIGSGMGEEVKSIPLKTAATPSPESSPPPPPPSASPAPPPRAYRAQRKIVSSDEEMEEEKGGSSPSLFNLSYKLMNTAKVAPRPVQRPTPVQTRADKILNAGLKTYSKRKTNEKWVTTKCRTSPRRTNQLSKSIFSSSPTKLFSDHSNMSKFNASASSDDKFYNLSFDALKKESGISPRMSYANFKIKKLCQPRETSSDDF